MATASIRADADEMIPSYVAEHAFEGDWRPEAGQSVTGSLWLQAYALGLVTKQLLSIVLLLALQAADVVASLVVSLQANGQDVYVNR